MSQSIIHPAYYLIVNHEPGAWAFHRGKVFYNPSSKPFDSENKEQRYGLTKRKIIIELFRINAGRLGYYLVNLRDKQYYYCGETLDDVQAKLLSLGIGRKDPPVDIE